MFSQGRGRGRCSSQSRSQENERQMSTIDLEVFYLKVVELFRDSSLCYQAILVLNYCGFMEMHILECIKPVCWPCSVHRPQCWGEIAVQQKHIYAICHSSCFKHADLLWTFRHTEALLSCVFTLASAFFRFLNNVLDLEFFQVNAVLFSPLFLFLSCVVSEFIWGRHRANLDTARSENHIMTSWKESEMATPEPAVNTDLFQTALGPSSPLSLSSPACTA